MSKLKLTLAFAAIVTAIGLVGPSSSPASILCTTNESGCPSESTYENGLIHFFLAEKATIVTNLGTITCKGNNGGTITNTGGEGNAVESEIGSFAFFECKESKGFACTLTSKNLPYEAKFEGSGGNGTMVVSDPLVLAVEASCPSAPINCMFSVESMSFTVTGGSPATLVASNIALARSGAQCPTSAIFSGEYKTSGFLSPLAMFIVDGALSPPPVRLCKGNATTICSWLARHPIGTALEGGLEGDSVFEFHYQGKPREPWCEEATFAGKTTEAATPLIGEVSAMTFKKCGGGVCAVEAQAMPYKTEIEKTTGGNGTFTLANGGGGPPKIEINCGKAFICVYDASNAIFTLTGGESPKLAIAQTLEKDASSEAECGATMDWTATYKLTKPTPLFVTS